MEKDIIAEKVFERIAMSRGVIVLDENVENLAKSLRDLNIKVIIPRSGLSDEKIKEELLTHRILITANTKHFLDDASIYEYGIISIEKLKGTEKEKVKSISKAIIENSLWSKKHGFLVTLDSKGNYTFKPLTD